MERSTSTKAQIWSLDLLVALIIFISAIFVFYKYSVNTSSIEEDTVGDLVLHAKVISGALMSAGFPENWTTANVTSLGLTNGQTLLSKDKIDQFSQLAITDYKNTRRLLSTTRNYHISFTDKNSTPIMIGSVGSIGGNHTLDNPDNLIRVVRFATYNGSLVQVVVHVW